MSGATVSTFEYPVGAIEDIPPGEGRNVVVNGRRIALFRTRSGKVRATQAECPHKGGPLADGIVGGTTVICPLHEFKFDLERGDAIGNTCERLQIFPARVSDAGEITVLVGPE